MMRVERCENQEQWDDGVLSRAGHPLQLWGWGDVKAAGNWRVERVFVYDGDAIVGAAQILFRRLPGPLKNIAYIPRGPVVTEEKREVVLEELASYIKKHHGSVAVTVEPDWQEKPNIQGWKVSPNTILLPRTVTLDLTLGEDALLGAMAKKTRQYIRKSEKAGVTVRLARTEGDIEACLAIYKLTAERANFGLHDDAYYHDIFTKLGDHCQVFMAEYEGRVVAFLWLAVSEDVAFELYGGMNDEGQDLRANYTLKWQAIRRTKEWGIARYDMNGLLNDGVSTFKQSFASHETQLVGTLEKPLSPLYVLWTNGLPLAKKLVRLLKK